VLPSAAGHPRAPLDLIPIAIAATVGVLLAAIELGSRSLWLDEGATFAIVSQHGGALWHAVAHDGGNMLLYYLVMHVVLAWFGDATWVMRLPSVMADGVTGALVAALAQRLFPANRRLATAAGLLAVVSLPLVYWGQNARGYAWMVTLAVGSFLALVAILQTPPGREPRRRALAAYVLSTLAALYVGYDVALLIPAQLVLLALTRERARVVLACLGLVVVLSVPLLVLAVERGSGQLFWVPPLSWSVVGQALLALLSAGLPPNFHPTATTIPTVILMGAAVGLGLLLAVRAVRGAPGAGPLRVILAWVLVPAVLTVLAYAAGEPIELPRVTILELPAVALLVAWLLTRPGVRPLLGGVGVAVLLALRLLQVTASYGVSPEPWSAVTAYVLRSTPPGVTTCIAFYAQDGREAFDYYLFALRRRRPDPAPNLRPVLPSLAWTTIRPYVERYATLDGAQRAAVLHTCPRLWLVSSHSGQSHGTRQSLANLRRYESLEGGLRALYPHTDARSFGWASSIEARLYW
jgi:hypothetical protein